MPAQFGFSLQGRGRLADRGAITALARRAEALGYDSIWVTDRLLIPVESRTRYPYSPTGAFPLGADEPWLEPLTAVTYLTTVTSRIVIGTSVLVIPYRNPVFTAKALATADYLSGGRVILGAGIGWWREEFAGLGIPFEDRAARTLEYLTIMKALWTSPRITYDGRFLRIPEAGGVRPYPVSRPHIPIWIGGSSDGALRRVAAIGDGWHPIGLRPPVALYPSELSGRVRRLQDLVTAAGRDPATITISFKAPLNLTEADGGASRTPLSGSPGQIVEDVLAYGAAGVRHFVFDFSVETVPEMMHILDRFATEVKPHIG